MPVTITDPSYAKQAQSAKTPAHYEALVEHRKAADHVRYLQNKMAQDPPQNDNREARRRELADAVERRDQARAVLREWE